MKFKVLPVLFCIVIFLYTDILSQPVIKKKQTKAINKILNMQENKNSYNDIAEIVNYIDEIYGDVPELLQKGGKITLYFGPAHGKDETERWRGITTNRVGVTGLPEEHYSMLYSRKLYNLLKRNKFINIAASDEYRKVLEGKSDSYHYMKFKDVCDNAKDAEAFMVIEMHMNNVSIFSKADGLVNMPGIHMARDSAGRKLLINIRGTFSGFLTLYNKYDSGGFSKQYALNIRDSLVKKGYKANNWDYGAVADDRFTYYLNFPISVIYECGFISHPEEEKKLSDPDYMDEMVRTQYNMLLKTFNDIYGIDISGSELEVRPKEYRSGIELLKLARLAIYFIQNADTAGANMAVKAMKEYYNSRTKDSIDYYSSIIRTINNAESYYHKGLKLRNKKKFNKARAAFVNAKSTLYRNSIYSAYRDKYSTALYGNRKNRTISDEKKPVLNWERKITETAVSARPSSVTKPFILSLGSEEKLEHALIESLNPDVHSLKIILDSMNNYRLVSYKKDRVYNPKKKKYRTVSRKEYHKFDFKPGIYIVRLDRNFRILKADRVSSVYLNPDKYQNQQYLKNSYFAKVDQDKQL
jgi:N-acetylmuramoyl-L-alanine amidase